MSDEVVYKMVGEGIGAAVMRGIIMAGLECIAVVAMVIFMVLQ